ncbi:hypothetical protein D3C85_1379530 [compost metagenome]
MGETKKRIRVQLVQIEVDGVFTDAKPCTSCQVVKVLDDFPTVSHGLGGRGSQCKACKKERTADSKKKYREDHKDKYREYSKRSRERNRDKIRERNRQRYQENPEQARASRRAYYHSNKDAIAANRKKHQPRIREYMKDYMRKRRAAQKETTTDVIQTSSRTP